MTSGVAGSFASRGLAGGGQSPLTLASAPNLQAWWSARYATSVRYATAAMDSSGTSPPIVFLTGSPASVFDFRIEVNDTTGGVNRGQAKFRWSKDGGTNWTSGVTTAATVALGSTGITANFASAAYTNNNVYIQTIGQFDDLSGHAYHLVENVAVANQPKISLTGCNGRAGLLFDGTLDRLQCDNATLATALAGGDDTPFTVFTVATVVGSVAGTHQLWAVSNLAAGTAQASLRVASSAYAAIKRGDADAADTRTGGTPDNSCHVFEYVHAGTTVSLLVDGVTIINAAAQDRSTCTMTSFQLGALLSVANVFGNVCIGECLAYSTALSAAHRGPIRNFLKSAWAL